MALHVRAKDIVICVPALLQLISLEAQNFLRVGFERPVASGRHVRSLRLVYKDKQEFEKGTDQLKVFEDVSLSCP